MIDLTTAYDDQDVIHTEPTNFERQFIKTTVGRAILNDHLKRGAPEMPYINGLLKKKGIGQLVNYCYLRFGLETTVRMLDEIKQLGFHYATRAGLSIGIDDMVIPQAKQELVRDAEKQVIAVQQQYLDGAITNGERYNKVVEIWSGDHGKSGRRDVRRHAGATTRPASSIRFTSWPTPAPAVRNSRSASSPACAA